MDLVGRAQPGAARRSPAAIKKRRIVHLASRSANSRARSWETAAGPEWAGPPSSSTISFRSRQTASTSYPQMRTLTSGRGRPKRSQSSMNRFSSSDLLRASWGMCALSAALSAALPGWPRVSSPEIRSGVVRRRKRASARARRRSGKGINGETSSRVRAGVVMGRRLWRVRSRWRGLWIRRSGREVCLAGELMSRRLGRFGIKRHHHAATAWLSAAPGPAWRRAAASCPSVESDR